MHMQTKEQRRPLIDPLLLALKSRRVLVALVALLVGLIVLALPELSALSHELLVLLLTLALALIGGYSLEDAAHAARQQAPTTIPSINEAELRALMREVINAMLDELLKDALLQDEETDAAL